MTDEIVRLTSFGFVKKELEKIRSDRINEIFDPPKLENSFGKEIKEHPISVPITPKSYKEFVD